MKYRKKPVVVEALQFTRSANPRRLAEWCGGEYVNSLDGREDQIAIETLEGTMFASRGDYIIRGVKGEFYPCKADIFKATYDPVVTP